MAGIGHYTYNLITAINKLNHEFRFIYFGYTRCSDVLDMPSGNTTQIKRMLALRRFLYDLHPSIGLLKRKLKHQHNTWLLRKNIKKYHATLFHSPTHDCPPCTIPSIVTAHDISCFRHPETHPAVRVRFDHSVLPKAIAQAAMVLTVSEFSRQEIINYFALDPQKIRVTHCGVGAQFKPRNDAQTMSVLTKYNLKHNGYILYVGTLEPRKNLSTLVDAYTMLPKAIQQHYPLVLVGAIGWMSDALLDKLKPLVASGVVGMIGYCSSHDLPTLISGSRLFVYPSLYEGFGMPVLEAMASGVACIVSNRASLPEVVGDSAITIDAMDCNLWAQSIQMMLEDSEKRIHFSALGLEQAKKFSWDDCARKTLDAYQQVLSSHA